MGMVVEENKTSTRSIHSNWVRFIQFFVVVVVVGLAGRAGVERQHCFCLS
jgi:hypothetical protein